MQHCASLNPTKCPQPSGFEQADVDNAALVESASATRNLIFVADEMTALTTLSRRKRRSEADIQIDRDDAQIEPAPLRDPVRLSVHSITSSARSRSDRGIVKPSAFAVLRLTDTSSL